MREAWGKFDRETGDYHPLAHHSMDVAAVFARLLELPVLRTRMEPGDLRDPRYELVWGRVEGSE